jgi:hypothetical protein
MDGSKKVNGLKQLKSIEKQKEEILKTQKS